MKKIFACIFVFLCLCACGRKEIYLPAEYEVAPEEEIFAVFPCLENGFCMALELDGDKNIVIGCGSSNDFSALYDFFRQRGTDRIDVLVLLSDNEENTGGLYKLASNFELMDVYAGEGMSNINRYRKLCAANSTGECNFYIAGEGTRIYGEDGVTIDVVSSRMCDTADGKRSSMSLYVTYGDTAIFIEGDGDYVAEREIIATMGDSIKSDIIVVPHGGAGDLPSRELLESVRPVYAVMPVYNGNYPLRRLMGALNESGAEVLRTDTEGTIVFSLNGKTVKYNIINEY